MKSFEFEFAFFFILLMQILNDGLVQAKLLIYDVDDDDFHTYVLKVINQLGEMQQREISLEHDSR